MSDTLVNQFLVAAGSDESAANEICSQFSHQISGKNLSLLGFVQLWGTHLTSENNSSRAKALACVSYTLQLLPGDTLSKSDVIVMLDFFLTKLDDTICLRETLAGIGCLITMKFFPSIKAETILQHLINGFNPKNHLAAVRYEGFRILKAIADSHRITTLFVKCFLHLANGEKDPRNLLISFELNSRISENFEVSELEAEELFDTAFCYFPISFKPPANDPYKISAEDLKTSLRDCIAANSLFAKDSFPQLLEKLTSTATVVRIDTLLAIKACVESYDNVTEYWMTLWNSLKFEVMHSDLNLQNGAKDFIETYVESPSDENRVVGLVLEIFTLMCRRLGEDSLNDFVSVVTSELNPQLSEKKAKQSSVILYAIARASSNCFETIMASSLDALLKLEDTSIPHQRTLINCISMLMLACQEQNGRGFADRRGDILMVFSRALATSKIEVSLRCLALQSFEAMLKLELLDMQESLLVIQQLTETLLLDDTPQTFSQCISTLQNVSSCQSGPILEITLPKLLALLDESEATREKTLDIIARLSTTKEIQDTVTVRLLNKLDDRNPQYTKTVLVTMLKIFSEATETTSHLKLFLPRLLSFALEACHFNKDSLVVNDEETIEICSKICKRIVGFSNTDNHQSVLEASVNVFLLDQHHSQLLYAPLSSPCNVLEQPSSIVSLFVKILAGLDYKKTVFPNPPLDRIISVCKGDLPVYAKMGYLTLLAVIVNKWQSIPFDMGKDLECFTWITKALVLKNDPLSDSYVSQLIDQVVENNPLSPKCLEIVVAPCDAFEKFKKPNPLTKKMVSFNINLRPLYKQKFYETVMPRLTNVYYNSDAKKNILAALSSILKYVDSQVIQTHLPQILPLLLQSIRNETVLNIIEIAILEAPSVVKPYLNVIVPQLLSYQKCNNATKISMLSCLLRLAIVVKFQDCPLTLSDMIPYRSQVLQGVEPALDDGKRNVRKLACDLREEFFELGQSA